jgi:hypothetical protein
MTRLGVRTATNRLPFSAFFHGALTTSWGIGGGAQPHSNAGRKGGGCFCVIFCTFAGNNIINMETLRIQVANPQAKVLLQDLAALKLITIQPTPKISELLTRLRSHSGIAPSLEEITQEVEAVRSARYAEN